MRWYHKAAAVLVVAAGLFFGGYFVGARASGGSADLRGAYDGVVSNLAASERARADAEAAAGKLQKQLTDTRAAVDRVIGERDRAERIARQLTASTDGARESVRTISSNLDGASDEADSIAGLLERAAAITGHVPAQGGE